MKTIILVAPNGARKTKKDHPNIPLTPEELGKEAKNCADAGAALYHLHIRDDDYKHSLDVARYEAAINQIKKYAGENIIIQCTTEQCGVYKPEDQIHMAKTLKPEAISVAIREIIPDESYLSKAADFLAWVEAHKIMPQYILYSPQEVEYFASLVNKQIVPGKKHFVLFVMGKKNNPDPKADWAVPHDLDKFLEAKQKFLSPDITWAMCSFGGNENACALYCAENGGHPRIGFENNHLLANGETAESNAALVKQLVAGLKATPATALEARKYFI